MNLPELKKKARELEIKGYSKLKKAELEEVIEAKEKELVEREEWTKYILENGEKKYEVVRRMAKHVDDCPINIRVYRGKSYANVIDDCTYCEFLLGESSNLGIYNTPEQYLICRGRKGIKKKFDYIRIPFDKPKYIQEKSKLYKHIYECDMCGQFYFDREIFHCNYTEKKDLSTYECSACGEKSIIKIEIKK